MLGQAIAHACSQRGLAFLAHTREQLDICDSTAVEAALDELRPWGVINAAGYTRLGRTEQESQSGHRVNVDGLRTLAGETNRRQLPLLAFSSDLVFDGRTSTPYVESSSVAPICQYGRIKAAAEVALFAMHPEALCVRVGSLFGGEDRWCLLTRALRNLAEGRSVSALHDVIVSPTYVPDVVCASLDLIVDGCQGLWHLANRGSVSWLEFIQRAAGMAGISMDQLSGYALDDVPGGAPRPRYSALNSEKGKLMVGLDTALERYCNSRRCNG
jgi:dTDP-4-dehydrorhamnose reductase